MSEDVMRAEALRMAVETCGRAHWHHVIEAAKEFYRYLANEEDDTIERMMRKQNV